MLDGKVAIVTGAGRGLGRAEALELAREGARVIVNDIGSEPDGSSAAAQEVVDEVEAAGGTATAFPGSVSNWDSGRDLVQHAVDTYGQLDILVNNAGILRERMLFNMSEEEWDAVIDVHLKGHFVTSRWATKYWRDRSKETGGPVYSRVVNTSSEAYLGGSPGQPNYAAAKAGIVALTLATAHGCHRYGVRANAICPRARTAMTEDLQGFERSDDDFDIFAVENVSPLVAYLSAPEADTITGQVFVIYGGMVTLLSPPGVEERFDTDHGPWTTDALSKTLAPFFADRDPLAEGYAFRGIPNPPN